MLSLQNIIPNHICFTCHKRAFFYTVWAQSSHHWKPNTTPNPSPTRPGGGSWGRGVCLTQWSAWGRVVGRGVCLTQNGTCFGFCRRVVWVCQLHFETYVRSIVVSQSFSACESGLFQQGVIHAQKSTNLLRKSKDTLGHLRRVSPPRNRFPKDTLGHLRRVGPHRKILLVKSIF